MTFKTVKPKWRLKACPRCKGDLFSDPGFTQSDDMACLQCGYRTYAFQPARKTNKGVARLFDKRRKVR